MLDWISKIIWKTCEEMVVYFERGVLAKAKPS